MTTLEFLKATLRFWYVVLLGGVATVLLFLVTTSTPPVYTSKVTVVLLMPHSTTNRNALQQPSPVAIASTAVIEVNNAPNTVRASSGDATLVGEGVTRGTSIELRHSGSQWAPSAPQPYIDIEAADTSPAAVQQRLTDAVDRVRAAIVRREDVYGVRNNQRVIVTVTPVRPSITSVPSSRSRAMAGSMAVGGACTVWAVSFLERRRRRRAATAAGTEDKSKDEAVTA